MKSMLKLLPYIRPYRWMFFAAVAFGAFMSISQSGVPVVVRPLFDDVFVNKNAADALKYSFLLPALYILHGLARFFHMYALRIIGERVATQIQRDLQDKYMRLNLSHYSTSNTGAMISKTINDITVIKEGIATFAEILREPLSAILMLGWLIYLDWKLTCAIIAAAPLVVFVINRLSKSVRKYSHRQQESMEMFTSTLKETVDGVRIIQSFNLSGEMRKRLETVIDYYISVRKKIIARQEGSGPISEVLVAIVVGLVFYYAGQRVIQGTWSVGHIMSYLAALAYLNPPLKKLQEGVMKIQPTVASIDRIFEVLDSTDTVPETPNAKPFPKNWEKIEFKNVSFAYGTQLVLKKINITIKKGEVIALVGESGSGKSTLVNLLERFYDPTEGDILIGGVSTRDLQLKDLRDNIALVTQDVFLFNDTIDMNIRSGNFAKEHHTVEASARMANAHDFIMRIPEGYKSVVGDRGGRLSGGEKQRISIARAIYKNAPILILDEATSALDSASEVEVQKGLDKLIEGHTAFVIAHRLSTVVKADRILVFKDGEIVESGTHQELMDRKSAYHQFHLLQKI